MHTLALHPYLLWKSELASITRQLFYVDASSAWPSCDHMWPCAFGRGQRRHSIWGKSQTWSMTCLQMSLTTYISLTYNICIYIYRSCRYFLVISDTYDLHITNTICSDTDTHWVLFLPLFMDRCQFAKCSPGLVEGHRTWPRWKSCNSSKRMPCLECIMCLDWVVLVHSAGLGWFLCTERH